MERAPDDQAVSSRGFGGHATQDSANARNELARTERLRQIIIRSQLEPYDPVDFLSPRGQHDDRNASHRANPPQHLETRELRQHHIEDYQIHARASELLESCGSCRGSADDEAFGTEVLDEHGAELLVIVDDEQSRLRLDGGTAGFHLRNDTRTVGLADGSRCQIKISLHWRPQELSPRTACVRTRTQAARIAPVRDGAFEAEYLIQDLPASGSIDPRPASFLGSAGLMVAELGVGRGRRQTHTHGSRRVDESVLQSSSKSNSAIGVTER